ncbi:MAG TPA: hypothetical protein VHX60_13360 [Acidobacteriaceae bacterium]|jgi:hypothetical protein|nr:hypothetical protein [Acidobacteriaceae bacterium]
MRSGWRIAAIGLLLALPAGCGHKRAKAAPPLAAQAPTRPPAQMAQLIPSMPQVPPAASSEPIKLDTSVPEEEASTSKAPPPHHVRHHPKAVTQEGADSKAAAVSDTPAPNPEVASAPPSDVSPIGQLSTANSDANTADRQSLTDQLNATEYKLNGIHRSLSADEQKTAGLIRTFISKARQALKTEDLDGARNYNTKAKILLQELTKP